MYFGLQAFLREATALFEAIPPIDERLVRVPTPDQWLFNEATFRPQAQTLLTESARLPEASRVGITDSPEVRYYAYMMRAPVGFGAAYRSAVETKQRFDPQREFDTLGGLGPAISPPRP